MAVVRRVREVAGVVLGTDLPRWVVEFVAADWPGGDREWYSARLGWVESHPDVDVEGWVEAHGLTIRLAALTPSEFLDETYDGDNPAMVARGYVWDGRHWIPDHVVAHANCTLRESP